MGALIEAPPRKLSLFDLAGISPTLAEQVSRFVLRHEGFSVSDYLSLSGGRQVEYVDGSLQVLPMPDAMHQAIIAVLYNMLVAWSKPIDPLARAKFSPFPVHLTPTVYREPDVCFMLGRNASRRHSDHWDGADLVVQIVSETNRDHDEVTKRAEYAAAGIPEYWIIDPELRRVIVLTLPAHGLREYAVHGDFGGGDTITSIVLAGFSIGLSALFAAAESEA